ncbi:hypothetical protein JKP88DRAFT_286021 [Tribonema minus]|uniref:Uncharacterized protein n=1 Tax=Tribonema minus TaxID=303371 RepID=A0A835ZFR1_9STRA|nr:hypothetical protein JKP88DRAFT_286021 [Tribonema minus]
MLGKWIDDKKSKYLESHTERVKVMQKALEMWWRMGEVAPGQETSTTCKACSGHGTRQCRFCSGHGLIRAGGGEAMTCPICKTRGVEACDACHGAGRIAVWMRFAEDRAEVQSS